VAFGYTIIFQCVIAFPWRDAHATSMCIPAAVLHLMKMNHLSREQLCRSAGINRSHLYKVLTGRHTPSVLLLSRLAQALKVKPSELLALAETLGCGDDAEAH
jgi:transcriptional regulator with XRE-family HTH domain